MRQLHLTDEETNIVYVFDLNDEKFACASER